ncbi:MCM6 [Hepatospora eriocheir]|uniref:DNA helicase n=1 Tax=Hepatospora eriocheir TaxID=1081669 RepID=A0A1X0Q963_9MICR|nr:MCM6 [Hepatospora eriocheir]
MLSDLGVCCIDEFDKMTIKDQVSIHEAMEQQTLTIAKAGINATLNSRASILAAANPVKGRYDRKKTLKQNVNLSLPIMSRFDLYFVLIDKADVENDRMISKCILRNHQKYNEADELQDDFSYFSVEDVIHFIKEIKTRTPIINETASQELNIAYNKLRQESLVNKNNYSVTIRHLESLIRLSEALAKIHNSPEVNSAHINEAVRLLKSSFVEVRKSDIILSSNQENNLNVTIKQREYESITNSLIYLVKSNELSKDEIILKYLELVEDTIENVQMIDVIKEKVNQVVEFLITNEGVLYEVENVLFVHPNFDL